MDEKKARSKRVVEAFELLKSKGIVKNQKDFCDAINYNYASFNQVLAGSRNFPFDKIEEISKKYAISVNYLLSGEGEILNTTSILEEPKVEYDNSKDLLVAALQDTIEAQKQLIKVKDQTIEFLEREQKEMRQTITTLKEKLKLTSKQKA